MTPKTPSKLLEQIEEQQGAVAIAGRELTAEGMEVRTPTRGEFFGVLGRVSAPSAPSAIGFLDPLSPGVYVVSETVWIVCDAPVESDAMTRRPLVVVDPFDPEGRTIITRDKRAGSHPYFASRQTDVELTCGKCSQVLLSGVRQEDFAHIVFHCPGCGSYNEIN